ncbi:MAG TPA: GWxTD domain-containing protein [Candidatus Acidoferrum sp.]|nr:GWxTD domain-containing protein [Candidatus Acidoferrum sp.]
MRPFKSLAFIGVISASLLVPILHAQNPPTSSTQSGTGQQGQTQTQPQKPPLTKAQREKAKKELDNAYKIWLEEDVRYIITPGEQEAFLRLSTNEEREQFIEQFWLRRDPTPDTPENEFKEEHYRRIAYANEHFASGVPGWKTDRGWIYILWGPPDTKDQHPSGGFYQRPDKEGGGETETFPFEQWHYNYLPGLGNNINLEFVDASGSNEYKLETDPEAKDALLYVPGAGLSDLEDQGLADKTQRFYRGDGTNMPTSVYDIPGQTQEFERYELAAKIFVAPTPQNKELEALVSARIVRNQLPFDYRFDYLRITDDTINVPITIQIANRQLTFQSKEGVHSAKVNILGIISTLGDRRVQSFEDTLNRDFPDTLFQQYVTKQSIYQKTVPLRPGLYKLDIIIKDVQSGNVGTISTRLAVPRFEQEKLDTSTLILADDIENVPSGQVGIGQFVLGDVKVRPQLKQEFFPDQKMGIYLQVYNIKVDDKTHKSNVTLNFRVTQGAQEIWQHSQTSDDMKQVGNEMTIHSLLPLATFAPGKYKLTITINDQIANETITRGAEFTVRTPADTHTAAK